MKSCFWTALAALIVLPLAGHFASAQEWTRFRGPNGTGISSDSFPTHFDDKSIAWKITLPGGGHSSPVLWGKKIFVTCANDHTAERMILCIDATNGSTIWKQQIESHTYRQNGDNSYATSTPCVDADHLYVCWSTPEELSLAAFTHDGKKIWEQQFGSFISQHGSGQSPIVEGNIVLLTDLNEGPKSYIFGIDRNTGKILWKSPRTRSDKFSPATPCIYTPAGGKPEAVFLSKSEGFLGIDPQTGKTIWQAPGVFDARPVGSPVLSDGLIFGSCGDGPYGHQLVAVRPGTESSPGKQVWRTTDSTPYVPTMVAKEGLLFCWGDAGLVLCRKQKTGEIVWQQRVPGSYYSSPVCAGNILYNINKRGEVVAIAASDNFQLLGQTPLGEKCHATPAIVDGFMYIRTYTHLYCIKGKRNLAR